jgi:omega-amidase
MQNLKVTLIQDEVAWEDKATNLARLQASIDGASRPTDLMVLPEMFSTGFSMNAKLLAEDMDGTTVRWIRRLAQSCASDLLGSVMIAEGGRFFNRLLWAKPDGRLLTYDKKHLFRFAGEDKFYTAGSRHLTVELKGWRIRPFICYDLRFPIWTRSLSQGYDLAIFVANWPEQRALHWQILLRARAIENQSYVIGLNRVGQDGNQLTYRGGSAVIDPTGKVLLELGDRKKVDTVELSALTLKEYRAAFPAWMDADDELVKTPAG